jgi:hypothetical protein
MPKEDKTSKFFEVVKPDMAEVQEALLSMDHGALPIMIKWLKTYQNYIRFMNESKPQKNSLDLSTSPLYRLGQCNILEEIIQLPKAARKAIMKMDEQKK